MDCLLSLYLYSFCVIFPLHLPFALRHLLFFYNPHFPFFIQVLTFCFIFFRDYWQQIFLFEKWLLIFISYLIIFNSFDIKVYRVSGFCDIILLLYHFVRKIITSANGCLSEARQARLRFPIIRIIYPYACISELRDLSQTKWLATANYKRAGHLFDELPFLSDDATCHYPVVIITRVIILMLTTERQLELFSSVLLTLNCYRPTDHSTCLCGG